MGRVLLKSLGDGAIEAFDTLTRVTQPRLHCNLTHHFQISKSNKVTCWELNGPESLNLFKPLSQNVPSTVPNSNPSVGITMPARRALRILRKGRGLLFRSPSSRLTNYTPRFVIIRPNRSIPYTLRLAPLRRVRKKPDASRSQALPIPINSGQTHEVAKTGHQCWQLLEHIERMEALAISLQRQYLYWRRNHSRFPRYQLSYYRHSSGIHKIFRTRDYVGTQVSHRRKCIYASHLFLSLIRSQYFDADDWLPPLFIRRQRTMQGWLRAQTMVKDSSLDG